VKIAIYGNKLNAEVAPFLAAFFTTLSSKGILFSFYSPFYKRVCEFISLNIPVSFFNTKSDFDVTSDILFSIGGDGTLLDTVAFVYDLNIPVLGINTGRLGFLANITPDRLDEFVNVILNKKFKIAERSLLQCNADFISPDITPLALNEVTVQKKGPSIIAVHVWLDGMFMNTYWTDGLIVSTPTGSTAYSMSVGGPIAAPEAAIFIISPIASHNLSVRPIVVPDCSEMKLKIESRNGLFVTTIDHHSIESGDVYHVSILKSPYIFRLLYIEGSDFFSTIRQKLMWGADKRN
jgi:NAD+ kinase